MNRATARRVALPVVLWLAAALISGFTMRRHLDPFDEGVLLQAATRMSDGEWPYADFSWAYGPGQALLNLVGFELFAPSVLIWRVVRVAADATIALLVWTLVRREAGPRWALAGWLAAAVTIAQPTTANPVPVALAFALAAVTAAVAGRTVVAGLLAALAIFWRPDLGVVAVLAVAAALFVARDRRGAGRAAGVAALAAAALYAPFVVAAGVPRVWDSLVTAGVREGGAWRLPFPVDYGGALRGWPPAALAEDLKDVLGFYLPLIGVVALAVVAVALLARRRPSPAAAGLGVLALGTLGYLLSRADELHAQPLLVVLCALIPIAAAGLARPALLIAPLALILLAGSANRISALLRPPELEPVHLAGVPGIRVPPAEARALPALVAAVQRAVPEGEPIYVAPRRSDLVTLTNPLLYFLVGRPNVLHRDVLLQARPREQGEIVAALERRRPRAVIRWLDPISSRPEPNERGRPSGSRALDEYLASAYRTDQRFGAYELLVPR